MLVEIKRFNKEDRAVCTSLDVADTFEKRHADVLRAIDNLECSEEFTQRNYALSYYKDKSGKTNSMWIMTRDGFVFLAMSFTGEKAARFKEAYIRQFNEMEAAIYGKLIDREKGIAVRQALTKALQQSTENERMHGHAYSNYTNCIYKALFGETAAQMRERLGLERSTNLRDHFTPEELNAIQSTERLVSGLVDCGWGYERIKEFISTTNVKRLDG